MSELIILRDVNTIQLTQGKTALVDATDFAALSVSRWYARHCWGGAYYACRSFSHGGRQQWSYMHREVAAPRDGMGVDHVSRDTLDNTRDNLRPASPSDNQANRKKQHREGGTTSKFKGVSWDKRNRKWEARIEKDRRRTRLGYFDCELDAARAYNRAAVEMFGEFAKLNEGV
jgi:hypothetical protein